MCFAQPPNDFSSNLQELRAGTENVGLAVGLVSNQNLEGTERFKGVPAGNSMQDVVPRPAGIDDGTGAHRVLSSKMNLTPRCDKLVSSEVCMCSCRQSLSDK